MTKTDLPLTELERTQELFNFLQGTVPEGYVIKENEIPRLSPERAWTVIWYLGELRWQVPDHIERCEVCGDLYDSEKGGGYSEDGPPYHFCDPCWSQEVPEEDSDA